MSESEEVVSELREASLERQQVAWSRMNGGHEYTLASILADKAADLIERLALEVATARQEGERAGLERAARYHDEWADRNLETCRAATTSRRHRKYASDIRGGCWIPPKPVGGSDA